MPPIRAIIVDDEQPAIEMLKVLLEMDDRVEVAGTFQKPTAVLAAMAALQPNVVFLDIQMPLLNGLELAEQLTAEYEDLELVFVTAYDEYALEAFKVNAIDYLLKPIMEQDLERAIARIVKRKRSAVSNVLPIEKHMNVCCFGGFTVIGNGPGQAAVNWRIAKAQETAAYLYMKRGQEISKWEIMEDIWPELTKEQAHNHLHTTIYLVRKTLKAYGIDAKIHFRNAHYRLESDQLWSDVDQFEQWSGNGQAINQLTLKDYEHCLSLYTGELFGSWSYQWSMQLREQYQQQFVRLTKQLCAYMLHTEAYSQIIPRIKRLIDLQPLDEEAYEMLLLVYQKMNNKIDFISQYQRLEEVLQAELNVLPQESVRRLYTSWVG